MLEKIKITQTEAKRIRKEAVDILMKSGTAIHPFEIKKMEIADFGLNEIRVSGAQIITSIDTAQIWAKLVIMLPGQTLPEHTHPKIDEYAGKEETVQCEWGKLYRYIPGDPTEFPQVDPPKHRKHTCSVWHECILNPGDQITFPPNTPHWFQGGLGGGVFLSFSTKVVDREDRCTDPDIQRETIIVDG